MLEARYASYPDLAEKIRQRFESPKKDLLDQCIKDNWEPICKEANFTVKQQEQILGLSILNPFCFQ